MCRISLHENDNRCITVRLEGRLLGPWVTEFRKTCDQLGHDRRTLSIDLGDVSFVDRTGLRFLQKLKAEGVVLERCSAFIEEELRVVGA